MDFGCGNGDVVSFACAKGYRFSGLESCYDTKWSTNISLSPTNGEHIYFYNGLERFPFGDQEFDFVFSNQVFEHIEHLDGTIAELYRILKPGGVMVHNFPTRESIIESHSGVPLLHRICNRRMREKIIMIWCNFGLGRKHTTATNCVEWVQDKLNFIDRCCFYRPAHVVSDAFSRHFLVRRADKEKLLYHLASINTPFRHLIHAVVKLTPEFLINHVEKRRGSITLICEKSASTK